MNRQHARETLRKGLPALSLLVVILGLALASTAHAEDPVVSVGPLGAGGSSASASAHDDPAAAACIGDEALDLGLSGSSDAVCAASAGGATSVTGSSGSGGVGAAGGAGGSGAAGASGGSAAAGTVSAAQAVGLRIVRVRTDLKRVRATKSFRLFVTLKDRRGLLVSGATVSAKRVPGRTATAASPRAVKSNKAGMARVAVRVRRSQFGKQLFVRVAARTPKATAVVQRSVRLPKLR